LSCWAGARRARPAGVRAYTNPAYRAAPHHALIAEKLEAVERGEIKRLMIAMPPRHGKSELASRRFPAWFMGRNADKQIIAASYNSDLANDFGREVRNIVDSPEFRALFDVSLAQDSQAANRWHTDTGGMYVAAGVGTAITGRGADILLIDDPFKDREEADSELRRQRVWDWYTSTAYTRLMPGGAIIVINTRWHDDDLSGRLIYEQDKGGDQWDVLSLPAIDGEGLALWPEWYPLERLEQIRGVLPARDWNALYQQNPIPDDGDYFKADWFGEYEVEPEEPEKVRRQRLRGDGRRRRLHRAGDCRGRPGRQHLRAGLVEEAGDLGRVDRGAVRPDREAPAGRVVRRGRADPPGGGAFLESPHERAASVLPAGVAVLDCRQADARRTIQGMASMGKVFLPKNAPWKGDLMNQLMRFPAGKHDDGVDVLSLFGRGLQMMGKPATGAHDFTQSAAAGARAI
jgi:hypothetical protein